MKRARIFFSALGLCLLIGLLDGVSAPAVPVLNSSQLLPIAEIVEQAVRAGEIPGAVVLIGNQGKIVYRQAFGTYRPKPEKRALLPDAIFDLASLTKVVATTTAVLQLVERGRIRLEDPAVRYWPEFKTGGQKQITLQQLLTHYSGMPAGLGLKAKWSGYEAALQKILKEKPVSPPGTHFLYSDLNFIILGELVRRISGQALDEYCREQIFKPLRMNHTFFKPPKDQQGRVAPTRGKEIGRVHDSLAHRMGGVSGHAGLFSTADDLAIFAQTLLDGVENGRGRILSSFMIEKMTAPQSPPDKMPMRGLGWDLDAPFSSNRTELFPVGSYGHKGYTGTGIWIDSVSKTYVIILTNRVYPNGKGDAEPLRARILALVCEVLGPLSEEQALASRPALANYMEPVKDYSGKLQTGIDVLVANRFRPLVGFRVGLITNHTGLDSAARKTSDLLFKAPGVKLSAIFTPEHGLSGKEEEKISSTREPGTGLPVHSLYGATLRPTKDMLHGLDALVFDIQDVGVRFYTYITTMGYAMEAAAENGILFFVLDRPNPISGSFVQGPTMEQNFKSFTGYFPMPIRHGMTVGELAKMFNAENRVGAKLRVIKMSGYQRTHWYDETGLPWVNPSPNLRNLTQATLYPGVAMVEGANVSVGRGTDTPFELLGAPWIKAGEFAEYLNHRGIRGITFLPADFMPRANRFKNEVCHGVQMILTDRQRLDSPALGMEILCALYQLYPKTFQVDKTLSLVGAQWILQAVKEGKSPSFITGHWEKSLEEFKKVRSKYLLY